jgi:hypothetical protein
MHASSDDNLAGRLKKRNVLTQYPRAKGRVAAPRVPSIIPAEGPQFRLSADLHFAEAQ